ncbi:MAG: class I SAM-dependent RNA methyltransferase [Sphingomonadales bacterium]|nr:class I SAM-dependent RNA methyltransferase [Sphingomonadales bacterium]
MKTIISLAARGDGIADDGSYYASTAPGDSVQDDGTIVPGPHHAAPVCPHFGTCGGCQLQHIDDHAYADFLRDRIRSALSAQGIAFERFEEAHVSPTHSRRRAALTAERKGRQVLLGFNEASSHRITDVRSCAVLDPHLEDLVAPLRRLLATLLPERKRATVRMTCADQGVDLLLAGVDVEGLAATESLTEFAAHHKLARLSIDEGFGPSARWEPEPVTITLGAVPVALPEGAFLQATPQGEAALVNAVRHAVASRLTIADLFAGLGTFALSIDGVTYAAEGGRDPLIALQASARKAGKQIACEHRDLFRRALSPDELDRFDAVILDPPRAGAKEQVEQLAKSRVACIAYASCNPSTFARDAKLLIDAGYRLDSIKPVGQFRWSTHVELAATFSR